MGFLQRAARRFGFQFVPAQKAGSLRAADADRGWTTLWTGGGYSPWQITQGFQLDINPNRADLQRNWTVFACQTLIAGDIGKLRPALVERIDGVWQETDSPAYSGLLREPNAFQTWQQFIESWVLSKLRAGNAYVLLERDQAKRVSAMYVLAPDRVTPLVSSNGEVYYRLNSDDLARVPHGDDVIVPASDIIHDRFNCLFHSLVGLSPLFACALAAQSGITMQEESLQFFRNGAQPGGIISAPQPISDELAQTYKTRWETNFGSGNRGRTAVLGSGLKYEPLSQNNVDSELVALLKLSAEMVCTVFHVPAFRVGVGPVPIQSAAEVLTQIYYDTCLQTHIEAIEALLDKALELDNVGGRKLRARFDLDDLLRMDPVRLGALVKDLAGAGVMAPNEGRAKFGLGPVEGGASPLAQQQNFSLQALAKRDAREDPFAPSAPPAAAPEPQGKELAHGTFPGAERAMVDGQLMVKCWDGDGNETWVLDSAFLDRSAGLEFANKWVVSKAMPTFSPITGGSDP